jgi:cysteine sulfinate desulfinase/cysteine desulfurase-like protein
LRAIGLTAEEAACSVRFSIGRFTTGDEVDGAIELAARALAEINTIMAVA